MQAQKDGCTEAKEINLQKDDDQKYEFNAEEVVEQWVLCVEPTSKH
jgi:hypothetical protein